MSTVPVQVAHGELHGVHISAMSMYSPVVQAVKHEFSYFLNPELHVRQLVASFSQLAHPVAQLRQLIPCRKVADGHESKQFPFDTTCEEAIQLSQVVLSTEHVKHGGVQTTQSVPT